MHANVGTLARASASSVAGGAARLLVDPGGGVGGPGGEALGEPQLDLRLGGGGAVGAVDQVAALQRGDGKDAGCGRKP